MDVLLDLYSNLDINQALIYCNTKKRVLELEKTMLRLFLANFLSHLNEIVMQCKSCWQHLLVAAICCALH